MMEVCILFSSTRMNYRFLLIDYVYQIGHCYSDIESGILM